VLSKWRIGKVRFLRAVVWKRMFDHEPARSSRGYTVEWKDIPLEINEAMVSIYRFAGIAIAQTFTTSTPTWWSNVLM
jgi:hypothetical protein